MISALFKYVGLCSLGFSTNIYRATAELQVHRRGRDHFLFTFLAMTLGQGLVHPLGHMLCVMLLLSAWPESRGWVSLGLGGSSHSLKLANLSRDWRFLIVASLINPLN